MTLTRMKFPSGDFGTHNYAIYLVPGAAGANLFVFFFHLLKGFETEGVEKKILDKQPNVISHPTLCLSLKVRLNHRKNVVIQMLFHDRRQKTTKTLLKLVKGVRIRLC